MRRNDVGFVALFEEDKVELLARDILGNKRQDLLLECVGRVQWDREGLGVLLAPFFSWTGEINRLWRWLRRNERITLVGLKKVFTARYGVRGLLWEVVVGELLERRDEGVTE